MFPLLSQVVDCNDKGKMNGVLVYSGPTRLPR